MMDRQLAARAIAACCALLFLSACAETQLAVYAAKSVANGARPTPPPASQPRAEGTYKVGSPYQVAGVWYYPKEDPHYDEKGIASWYGSDFHGRSTANGETYDMNDLSAAHKTLPLPTMVRVTNLENGRSLVLRVNDRGPFVHGRIIDVSRRAAQLLGFIQQGTARVRVEALSGKSEFVARKPETTEEERRAVAAVPQSGVSAQALPPPAGVEEEPVRVATTETMVTDAAPQARIATTATSQRSIVSTQPVRPSVLFIQAGAFVDVTKARVLRMQLAGIGDTRIVPVFRDGMQFYRVRVGPLPSVAEADRTLERIISAGHPDARIVIVD